MKRPDFHVLQTIITVLLFMLVLAVGSIVILTGLREIGGFRVYVVNSGSMEPEIPTGSLIVTQRALEYQPGDIISFMLPSNYRTIITHRIVEATTVFEQPAFITKGDANTDADPDAVPARNIVGKLFLTIPYLGYLIEFARTPVGVMVLLVIPGTIILWEESKNIYRIVTKWREKPAEKKG